MGLARGHGLEKVEKHCFSVCGFQFIDAGQWLGYVTTLWIFLLLQ